MLEYNLFIFEKLSSLKNFHLIGVLADAPIFFLPVFLISMWLYYIYVQKSTKQRRKLIHIFYVCVLGISFSYFIKLFFDIERPETYVEQTKSLIFNHIPKNSFPSDHATISLAFLTSLFYTGFKKIGYFFLPFVVLMNISRIIIGVHWPLDIFVGILLGILSGYVFFTYFSKLKLVKNIDCFIIKVTKYIKFY